MQKGKRAQNCHKLLGSLVPGFFCFLLYVSRWIRRFCLRPREEISSEMFQNGQHRHHRLNGFGNFSNFFPTIFVFTSIVSEYLFIFFLLSFDRIIANGQHTLTLHFPSHFRASTRYFSRFFLFCIFLPLSRLAISAAGLITFSTLRLSSRAQNSSFFF